MQLGGIFDEINLSHGSRDGKLDLGRLYLLNKEETYEYVIYFELYGENPRGYTKLIFNDCKKVMIGRKFFDE